MFTPYMYCKPSKKCWPINLVKRLTNLDDNEYTLPCIEMYAYHKHYSILKTKETL